MSSSTAPKTSPTPAPHRGRAWASGPAVLSARSHHLPRRVRRPRPTGRSAPIREPRIRNKKTTPPWRRELRVVQPVPAPSPSHPASNSPWRDDLRVVHCSRSSPVPSPQGPGDRARRSSAESCIFYSNGLGRHRVRPAPDPSPALANTPTALLTNRVTRRALLVRAGATPANTPIRPRQAEPSCSPQP
jgi:hypothetical protein